MENKKIRHDFWRDSQITLRILGLILVGFLFFELIPITLDQNLDTQTTKTAWFFVTAFAIFINIHHFFIDSVVWRLQQSQVSQGLFAAKA